jgi:CheY-like chemotaxis protein
MPPGVKCTATILLAEDEESLRNLTKLLLEAEGYSVLEAENGTAALNIAGSHDGTIELLITDLKMPGMNGRDLATRLKHRHPTIKVLYITGYFDSAEVLDTDTQVLEKPFTPDTLLRMVHTVLAGHDEPTKSGTGF